MPGLQILYEPSAECYHRHSTSVSNLQNKAITTSAKNAEQQRYRATPEVYKNFYHVIRTFLEDFSRTRKDSDGWSYISGIKKKKRLHNDWIGKKMRTEKRSKWELRSQQDKSINRTTKEWMVLTKNGQEPGTSWLDGYIFSFSLSLSLSLSLFLSLYLHLSLSLSLYEFLSDLDYA